MTLSLPAVLVMLAVSSAKRSALEERLTYYKSPEVRHSQCAECDLVRIQRLEDMLAVASAEVIALEGLRDGLSCPDPEVVLIEPLPLDGQ